MAEYASRFQMLVVMANHAASIGSYVSVGKSSVWAPDGALLAEATGTRNSLVMATRSRDRWCGEAIDL